MFRFEHLKETIAVFISNVKSDHEISFEIKDTIIQDTLTSIISGSNWECLNFNPIYPYAYKKECIQTSNNHLSSFPLLKYLCYY